MSYTLWFFVFTKNRPDFVPIKTLPDLERILGDHFHENENEPVVLMSSGSWDCSSTVHYDAYQDTTADDLAETIEFIGIFHSTTDAFSAAEKEISQVAV